MSQVSIPALLSALPMDDEPVGSLIRLPTVTTLFE
jgi:hypothetical protein